MTKTIKTQRDRVAAYPMGFTYLQAEIMRDLLKHQVENDIVPLEYDDAVQDLLDKFNKYLLICVSDKEVGDADDNL